MNKKFVLGAVCLIVALAVFASRNDAQKLDCPADALQDKLGTSAKDFDATRIRNDIRLIRAGDAYTQDHNPARLNIQLDEDDLIARIWCG